MHALKELTTRLRPALLLTVVALGAVHAAAAQVAERTGAPQEGIKVHGYWTIDILNSDGTLARHVEFENGLQGGGTHLAALLTRNAAMGYWSVDLHDSNPTTSPCQGGTALDPSSCFILESAGTDLAGTNVFKTLTVSSTGLNNSQIVLQGTATATSNGQVGAVHTNFGLCPSSAVPGGCGRTYLGISFSGTGLTPIPVVPGQIIQLKVVISFS